jgi:hypothetical protein
MYILGGKKDMKVKQIWRKSFCCYYEESQGILQSLKPNKDLRNFSTVTEKGSDRNTIVCAKREINWIKRTPTNMKVFAKMKTISR